MIPEGTMFKVGDVVMVTRPPLDWNRKTPDDLYIDELMEDYYGDIDEVVLVYDNNRVQLSQSTWTWDRWCLELVGTPDFDGLEDLL